MAITKEHVLYISVNSINPDPNVTYPNAVELVEKFLQKPLSDEALQDLLKVHVVAGTNIEAIQLLIDAGADVNYTYTGGSKLLFMAHKNDNPEVVKILLKNGASFTPKEQEFFQDIDPVFASIPGLIKASEKPKHSAQSSKP